MSPRPFLHQTDLFRPPIDPDDHWDLACVFALAARGDLELNGVLLDYPPEHFPGRSPDVCGIAQLGYLTGLAAPVSVGSAVPFEPGAAEDLGPRERAGAEFVLRTLRVSTGPLVITVVGSCRDVARALEREPELFAAKCAGIYLNAGTGSPDPSQAARLEYNVELNPAAYAQLFRAPCPVFWMPCFEEIGVEEVRRYGTWYRFRQDQILPYLTAELQGYFAYSLEGRTDARYLTPVVEPEREAPSPYTGWSDRSMWCTAGFFHAAGYTVTRSGEVVPLAAAGEDGVFGFAPVSVECDKAGVTRWHHEPAARERFIFQVLDTDAYAEAMTVAMRRLLSAI